MGHSSRNLATLSFGLLLNKYNAEAPGQASSANIPPAPSGLGLGLALGPGFRVCVRH